MLTEPLRQSEDMAVWPNPKRLRDPALDVRGRAKTPSCVLTHACADAVAPNGTCPPLANARCAGVFAPRGKAMPKMTGGQALAKSLYREGVRVIFGLPGVQLYHLLDGLYDEPGIRFITTPFGQNIRTCFPTGSYASPIAHASACL